MLLNNLKEFKITPEEKNLFEYFDYEKYLKNKPPSNDSFTTKQEIKELQKIPINDRLVEEGDEVEKVFGNIVGGNEDDLIKLLINGSVPVIHKIKYHHLRPRPRELAKKFNIRLNSKEMESMDTPSYPSGHSAQAYLLADVLSDRYPDKKEVFQKAARDVSFSRNIARSHYKSDSVVGEELGKDLYKYLKNKT
mgnify:CR=1 FL=1